MKKHLLSVAAFCLAAIGLAYEPPANTNSFTKEGVTYAQRGGLGASDFVVTNIDASAFGAVKSVNGLKGDVVLSTANIKHGYSSLHNVINSVEGNTQRHIDNKNNPHAVTAAQVGAVPLVEDTANAKTAVTIGSRKRGEPVGVYSLANGNGVIASGYSSHAEGGNTTTSGNHSHAEGYRTTASGDGSHAEGNRTTALGTCSHAEGLRTTASGYYSHAAGCLSQTKEDDIYAFAWNGDETRTVPYTSHGPGTFNINPAGGLNGFYIGDDKLSAIILGSVTNNISATNPTFSNAVLSVGLNIDTNAVAVLNEIAETFGGFPIEGTATTVGGLLAALAAAIAWLKKNKVGSFASVGGASATVENGVAKLSDFFTESNSLLTGLIARETGGKADQSDLDALASKVDTANAALEEVA